MRLFQKYVKMMRQDIREVMSYRCGLDELNNFLMLIGFIFIVVALFSHKWIFTLLGAVFVILCYIRVFSKKLDKRGNENAFYMKHMGWIVKACRQFNQNIKMKFRTIKDAEYAYFVCSSCSQIIRVPKGKSKVNIRCPKCSQTFIKRT